jgi:hypothetical protein
MWGPTPRGPQLPHRVHHRGGNYSCPICHIDLTGAARPVGVAAIRAVPAELNKTVNLSRQGTTHGRGSVEPADNAVAVPNSDVEPFFQRHAEALRASQPAATQIIVVVPEFVSANDEMFAIAFSHYILRVEVLDRPLSNIAGASLQSVNVGGVVVEEAVAKSESARHQPERQPEREEESPGRTYQNEECAADDPGNPKQGEEPRNKSDAVPRDVVKSNPHIFRRYFVELWRMRLHAHSMASADLPRDSNGLVSTFQPVIQNGTFLDPLRIETL